jgi:hypothetical protein
MRSPHLLKAGSNARRLRDNLTSVLDARALTLIDVELRSNVAALFRLGVSHFDFARGPAASHWRQRISRLYYAAYAVVRSVKLEVDGHYSTYVEDHAKVGDLPKDLNNQERYKNELGSLRDDRNLADYDHTADETELLIQPDDAEALVSSLVEDARALLTKRGVSV